MYTITIKSCRHCPWMSAATADIVRRCLRALQTLSMDVCSYYRHCPWKSVATTDIVRGCPRPLRTLSVDVRGQYGHCPWMSAASTDIVHGCLWALWTLSTGNFFLSTDFCCANTPRPKSVDFVHGFPRKSVESAVILQPGLWL